MNPEFSLPLLLAAFGFLLSDDTGSLLRKVLLSEYKWHNSDSIRERLSQLGRTEEADYENFRIAQMSQILFVTSLTIALYIATVISGSRAIGLTVIGGSLSVLLTERNLTNRCKKKREIIESEFPAIVEILTLAVGAGESTATAFKRISTRARGYLAQEINQVVIEIERGAAFSTALDEMSKRLNSEAVRRFSDSLIISSARGTSLVETLIHASNESRNLERVKLMTAAGKSEISMMIPVVFLVLPISILFALFPSLSNLNLFAG